MKKKILLFIICITLCFSLSANNISKLYIGLDLGYLDPLINKTLYNQLSIRFNICENLDLSLPINFIFPTTKGIEAFAVGGSLNLDYRPFNKGLFFSFSLFDIEYVFGQDAPPVRLKYLNQLGLGYSIYCFNNFIIEPSVIFINPNGVYDSNIEELRESLGGYPTVRFSLIVSYKIFEFENLEED